MLPDINNTSKNGSQERTLKKQGSGAAAPGASKGRNGKSKTNKGGSPVMNHSESV